MKIKKLMLVYYHSILCSSLVLQGVESRRKNPCIAVTMSTNGGRFGDHICNYLQAQWVSHITGFSFLCRPFQYSDQLELHYHDTVLTPEKIQSFKNHREKIPHRVESQMPYQSPTVQTLHMLAKKSHTRSTLYTVQFVPFGYDFDYRKDPFFMQKMRSLIAPHEPLPLITPPENYVSIAVHLRTGIDFDTEREKKKNVFRSRFVTLDFYAQAVHDAMQLIGARPLFIYVFTDHPEPEKPITEIQALLSAMQKGESAQKDTRNITWQWRTENNRHDNNVLIDFFSLLNFDCLIRPWSAFSGCAEILGDHALIIDVFRHALDKPILYRIKPNVQSKCFARLCMKEEHSKISALRSRKKNA